MACRELVARLPWLTHLYKRPDGLSRLGTDPVHVADHNLCFNESKRGNILSSATRQKLDAKRTRPPRDMLLRINAKSLVDAAMHMKVSLFVADKSEHTESEGTLDWGLANRARHFAVRVAQWCRLANVQRDNTCCDENSRTAVSTGLSPRIVTPLLFSAGP